jgi:transcription-repair coupling factor (superfamily II helicase)
MCGKLLIGSLRERGGLVEVEFSRVAGVSAQRVVALINDSKGRVRLDPRRPQVLVIQTGSVGLREKSEFIRDRLSRLL